MEELFNYYGRDELTLGEELFISAKGLTSPSPSRLECLCGFEDVSRKGPREDETPLFTDLSSLSPGCSFELNTETAEECLVISLSVWLCTLPS